MTYANGSRYEGGWQADKKHGTGTFTWASGKWEKATWEAGTKVEVLQSGTA